MQSHPEIALKAQSASNVRMIGGRHYGCLYVVLWTPGFPLFRDRLKSLTLKSYPKCQLRDRFFSPSDSAEGGSKLSVMSEWLGSAGCFPGRCSLPIKPHFHWCESQMWLLSEGYEPRGEVYTVTHLSVLQSLCCGVFSFSFSSSTSEKDKREPSLQ